MSLEFSHLLKIARDSVEERGLVQTLRQGPKYVATYLSRRKAWEKLEEADGFDKKYGTDTTSMVGPAEFGVSPEKVRYSTKYIATLPRTFERIMNAMDICFEDYTFIDFGSGKGRVLLLASELPFKRVVGVELSPRLHEIAQRNVQIFGAGTQQHRKIELVCTDATAYALPAENTVFYFFDPFELPILRAVIENIRQSLQGNQHRIFIAYVNPTYSVAMDRSGFLERIHAYHGGPPESAAEYPWSIYTNKVA
jgi:SAM-dependent methyltransferase